MVELASMGAPIQPLIVQSDHGILAETDNPLYPEVRETLGRFAE